MSDGNGKGITEMDMKFAHFDKMISEAKANGIKMVIVSSPQTLGDNYEELIRNLTKLQQADLSLNIVPNPKK